MHRFSINMPREPKWFKACAEGYLLSGRLNDICDHNAIVARNAGRNDVNGFSIFLYNTCITVQIVTNRNIISTRLVQYGVS